MHILQTVKKKVLYRPGGQSFSAVRCTPIHRTHRKPHWHCCPCSLPPVDTVGAGKSALRAYVLPLTSPPSFGACGYWKSKGPQEGLSSHLMGEPHQYTLAESLPHHKSPPPAAGKLAGDWWRGVRWLSQSSPPEGDLMTQSRGEGTQLHVWPQNWTAHYSYCRHCCSTLDNQVLSPLLGFGASQPSFTWESTKRSF